MKSHEESDAERIVRVESDIATLKGSVANIQETLRTMNGKLSDIGKPNGMLIIGLLTVVLSVGGMAAGTLLYVTKSEITNQVTPVALKAASSETDRHRLNDQVYRNVSDIAEVKQMVMIERERGVERETQNRALAQFSNMRQSQNMQLFGVLWNKVYGQPLPTTTFHPDISFSRPHGN